MRESSRTLSSARHPAPSSSASALGAGSRASTRFKELVSDFGFRFCRGYKYPDFVELLAANPVSGPLMRRAVGANQLAPFVERGLIFIHIP